MKKLTGSMALLFSVALAAAGCNAQPQFTAPPYIPAAYYDCIEAAPQDLVQTYYYGYGDIYVAKTKYDNKVFVFKNVLIDELILRELDKGWLWMDLVKCPLANPEEMKKYKVGDRIDLVGLNLGQPSEHEKILLFAECYVLAPGVLKLPAEGGAVMAPAY